MVPQCRDLEAGVQVDQAEASSHIKSVWVQSGGTHLIKDFAPGWGDKFMEYEHQSGTLCSLHKTVA